MINLHRFYIYCHSCFIKLKIDESNILIYTPMPCAKNFCENCREKFSPKDYKMFKYKRYPVDT